MSRIDDLVKQFAPNGVEFKALGEIGEFIRGNGLQKSDLTNEGFPAVHYGQIHTFYKTWTKTSKSFVDPLKAAKLRRARPGDLIIATTSEDDAAVAKATAWIGEGEVAVSGDAYIFRHSQDPRFVAYFFQSEHFQSQKTKHLTGTKVRRVSGDSLAKIQIPVPPLEVQAEIAARLDCFAELDRLLLMEVELRLRLRSEVSRRLVTAASELKGTERVRLGDITSQWVDPVRVEPQEMYSNLGVKWYGEGVFSRDPKPGQEIKGSILYKVKSGQLILNRMFVTEGSFAIVPPDLATGVVSNEFPVYDLDESRVLPSWLLLYLLDEFTLKRIERAVTGTERGSMKSRRRWKDEQFRTFEVGLPPLDEQRQVLRAIESYKELEASLVAEKKARRKQYEYYREKLLTFEEATA